MGSVRFDSTDVLSKSMANPASSTYGGWWKVGSFTGYRELMSFDGSQFEVVPQIETAHSASINSDDTGTLSGLGSGFTGWAFIGRTHATGSDIWTIYYREEGVSTFTSFTLTRAGDLTSDTFYVGGSPYGADSEVSGRSVFVKDSVLSAADLLTASSSLSAPAGTNLVFLALSSAATAATNGGTNGDFTVGGTLADDADEPDPSIGGGGGGGVTIDHQSVLSFPALCRRPQNDNGRWIRNQGGLYVPRRAA